MGLLPLFQSRLFLCFGCCTCFSHVWFSSGVAAHFSVSSGSLVGVLPLFQSHPVLWWVVAPVSVSSCSLVGVLPLFQSRPVLWWVVAHVSVSSGSLVGVLPLFQSRLVLWWVAALVSVSSDSLVGLLPLFQSRLVLCWGCCPCFSLVWLSRRVVAPVSASLRAVTKGRRSG